ncbi:GIY-YIG nuclease family protein [bacterium]|nr:GIY-YIG nuclease family protein [bacterium]
MSWYVYVIESVSGKFYTGIATDPVRRFYEHATDYKKGAKFFRSDPPAKILYLEKKLNRSKATIRECEIKKLTRAQKEKLVSK